MYVPMANEWLSWTNSEPCTLQSTAFTGSSSNIVPVCIKRDVTTREMANSNGAYQGSDVSFLIPAALLNQPYTPKPGDVVTDKNGISYTVIPLGVKGLARDGVNGYSIWKLFCRNMVIAYQLQDLIEIQIPIGTLDATGTEIKAWIPSYVNLPARVQIRDMEPADERGIHGAAALYDVYLSQNVQVVPHRDRIPWKFALGGYLEITESREMFDINSLPVLTCRNAP